jgi:preprotein translocase subunit SecB
VLNLQYIKDLSFEVPDASKMFFTLCKQPSVDVQAWPLQEGSNVYDVSPQICTDAQAQEQTCFIAGLADCGIFTISVEPEVLKPVLLFPYARNILAEVTRDGGCPPVTLAPVDFVALWQSPRCEPPPAGSHA